MVRVLQAGEQVVLEQTSELVLGCSGGKLHSLLVSVLALCTCPFNVVGHEPSVRARR